MITDRNKLNFVTIQWLWFLCLLLACCGGTWTHKVEATQQQQQQKLLQLQPQSTLQQQQEFESNGPPQKQQQPHQQQQQQQDVTVRNFSPRMDYNNNEWRPVGRGDPLKNDPTFDYSPPTLDRVRYWADSDKEKEKVDEVAAALVDAKLKKANPGKNEILLLGVTGDRDRDRLRGATQAHQHSVKNAKGETPLLQPKYTSIRRSYYAHQIPTHLMPPPMQPATQQLQATSHMVKPAHGDYQQQQQQQLHLMQSSSHMVKPLHTEYRHNMPGHSYMTSSPLSAMNMHSKPHFMSTATQSWMHSPSPQSASTMIMSGNSQRYSHPHDSHHQESVNYFSYNTRPHMASTPSIMTMNGAGHHDVYSPNSIRGSSGHHKSPSSSRKPWIHDLLQKEFIKPIKPNPMGSNSYHSETIKPQQHTESHFEPMLGSQGISSTYTPVTFVTPTMPSSPTTTTTQAVYITSSTYQTSTPSTTTTTAPSIYPTYTTQTPRTTSTTYSPTRLLIPNTSNLAFRPTVAPMKMTTDSLFSHYNQPDKPLRGPMYLIIEGHSKVKTYGKDELDPHKPKIVPIIPKREPVVRIADPNEKRGTPETFQVKHLHTKTTPIMATTTTTTTARTTTTTGTIPTTTKKPLMKTTTKFTTTIKPTTNTKTTQKMITSTTSKPITTKMTPKLSVATSTKPKVEKASSNNEKIPAKNLKSPNKTEKSAMDLKVSSKLNINNPNALETPQKPSQAVVNEPPTGMQGLLSFLDSSLGNIFQEDPLSSLETGKNETTTKLKPIVMKDGIQQHGQPQIEARISTTKLEAIKAEDYDDDNFFKVTTEYLPRETRQIFDYDQLPESRINDKENSNYNDLLENIDDEEDLSVFNFDDEYEEEEEGELVQDTGNTQQNLIKRIDSLVSSTEDDFDDVDINEDDLEAFAESRQHQAKKA